MSMSVQRVIRVTPALILLAACSAPPTKPAEPEPLVKAPGASASESRAPNPSSAAPTARPKAPATTIQRRSPEEIERLRRRQQDLASYERSRARKLKKLIDAGIRAELANDRMGAIRTYRDAARLAEGDQRRELNDMAQRLLEEQLEIDRSRGSRPEVAELPAGPGGPPAPSSGEGEADALADLSEASEETLASILRSTTPAGRLNDATRGAPNFLGRARAELGGPGPEADRRARELNEAFRAREAILASFSDQRRDYKARARKSRYQAVSVALDRHSDALSLGHKLAVFDAQDQALTQLFDAAQIVYRQNTYVRTRDNRTLPSVAYFSRGLDLAERAILERAVARLQARALREAENVSGESLRLILQGQSVRFERLLNDASDRGLQQGYEVTVDDLIYAVQSS